MSLVLRVADDFLADQDGQVAWYLERASVDVASRYLEAIKDTLSQLCQTPGVGARRQFKHPRLIGLRFHRVNRPFHTHVIFYRHDETIVFAERVIHGARDLPRRLLEPPGSQS
jgi:toxin ParE1/3/4